METLQPVQPARPISLSDTPKPSPAPAPEKPKIPGQISEQEALKGGEGAKINQVSLPGPGEQMTSGNSVSVGSLLEAKVAVEIVDSIIPSLLVILFAYASVVLKKTDFQLTAKEKDVLAPILQKCLESINLNFDSPWTVLAITLASFYGAKAMEKALPQVIENAAKKAKAPTKSEKLKEARETTKGQGKVIALSNEDPIPESTPIEPVPVEQIDPITIKNKVLNNWTDEDVEYLMKNKGIGRARAVERLTRNWHKKGGIIEKC